MKTVYSILLSLLFFILVVSCEKSAEEEQILMDTLSFSCKLNGEPVTIKSPIKISFGEESITCQRVANLNGFKKDSVIIGYSKSFGNDSLYIVVGYRKSILVDTTFNFYTDNKEIYFAKLFAPGSFTYLYDDPIWGVATSLPQIEGFYIQIVNMKNKITYTSYLKEISDYSEVKYKEFLSNNNCQIKELTIIDGKKQSYKRDGYYIDCEFDCKLYNNSNINRNSIQLSEGHINMVF